MRGVLTALLATSSLGCHGSASGPPAPPAGGPCDEGRGGSTTIAGFTRYAVDESAGGAAFVTAADLNGDGRLDLIVSRFGSYAIDGSTVHLTPATLDAYYGGSSLSCWHHVELVGRDAGWFFINEVTAGDVDGDGDIDLIVPSGFFVCGLDPAVKSCGALAWLENRPDGFVRHDLIGPGEPRFFHHAEWVDFDGDGRRDLVTVGELSSGPETVVLSGTADAARFSTTPTVLGAALGSFPQVVDVDGDGDLDVAAGEFFVPGQSFAWLERTADGRFAAHTMDATRGKGFALRLVDDLYGDGITRAVATNHTNVADDGGHAIPSAVFVLDPPADPKAPWSGHSISDGIRSRASAGAVVQGAPGVFGVGDIDGDGDLDVAVAGDGDARTFWLEQSAPGVFVTHTIEPALGQASGARVVDLDGDGANELVFTGYEAGAVYVYQRRR